MEVSTKATRRKVIDIPEDVFNYLSFKAAASGTDLKKYIEALLVKSVEEMGDEDAYSYLSETVPEGHVMIDGREKQEFESWLGISRK